jgi:hypothetical protein
MGGGAVTGWRRAFPPLFLWLGPLWLVFYWFIIFFATPATRADPDAVRAGHRAAPSCSI